MKASILFKLLCQRWLIAPLVLLVVVFVVTTADTQVVPGFKLPSAGVNTGDQSGFSVSISGNTAVSGARFGDSTVTDSGSAYVYVRDPVTDLWTEQAKLTATDAETGVMFGDAVAISGDTVVIGAMKDNDLGAKSGSAYVFFRAANGTWSQLDKLIASDGKANDQFGRSVAINGDTIIVGAKLGDGVTPDSGSAYVFVRNPATGVWAEQEKLTASDGFLDDFFGWSVALEGDTAIIGAILDDHASGTDSGSAYVFVRNPVTGVWAEQEKLTASDAAYNDGFGIAISISGNFAMIGADLDDEGTGSAYVFARDPNTGAWGEKTKLTASDKAVGDGFGRSISIQGDVALIGAALDNSPSSTNTGKAYVFVHDPVTDKWKEQAKMFADDAAIGDNFGFSVSVSDGFAVIGADWADQSGLLNAGAAYVYQIPFAVNDVAVTGKNISVELNVLDNEEHALGANLSLTNVSGPMNGLVEIITDKTVRYTPNHNFVGSDSFNYSAVDATGNRVTVNATAIINHLLADESKLNSNNPLRNEEFGRSAAISGDTLVVGADRFENKLNPVPVGPGAAYVFSRDPETRAWNLTAKLTPDVNQDKNHFGRSVAISGNTIVVGAHKQYVAGKKNAGAAYIFVGDPITNTWSQKAKLTASDSDFGDKFGVSVAIDDNVVIVGAPFADANITNTGAAYVFIRPTTGGWVNTNESAKLIASDGVPGDRFSTVSISLNTVAVGAPGAHVNAGAAYVFVRPSDGWSGVLPIPETAKLTPSASQTLNPGDSFGEESISISGDVIVVGASRYGNVSDVIPGEKVSKIVNPGVAFVFERPTEGWSGLHTESGVLNASDGASNDFFGFSVGVSGNKAIIGSWGARLNDGYNTGAAYVFERHPGTNIWEEKAKLAASDGAAKDVLGWFVAIDGTTAIATADVTKVDGLPYAGAAYVFELTADSGRSRGCLVPVQSPSEFYSLLLMLGLMFASLLLARRRAD